VPPKIAIEECLELSIKLDRDDIRASSEQGSGENPHTGADFDNQVVATDIGRDYDALDNVRVHEKVLPHRAGGLDPLLSEDRQPFLS